LNNGTSVSIGATIQVGIVNYNRNKHEDIAIYKAISFHSNEQVNPSKTGKNKGWHGRDKEQETDRCEIVWSHTSIYAPDKEVIQESSANEEISASISKETHLPNLSEEVFASTTVLTGEQSTAEQEKKRIKKERNKQASKRYRQKKKARERQTILETQVSLLKDDRDSARKIIAQQEEALKTLLQRYLNNKFDFGSQRIAMFQIQTYTEKHLRDIQIGQNKDETEFAKRWIIPELCKYIQEKKSDEEIRELYETTSRWLDMAKVVDEKFLDEITQDGTYEQFHRQTSDITKENSE